jgi:hypothetical protein
VVVRAAGEADARPGDEYGGAGAADRIGDSALVAQVLPAAENARQQIVAEGGRRRVVEAVEQATGTVGAHRANASLRADRPRLE